ncbi:Phloem protein 2-like [Arabidopsis suecica]|uniref:Phloem protein 2-like n=1 Tax=Arabidopsis suecica TaxID=45249 RepID=A0A8T2CLF5_ARASU|nr:Phloem protein 2-like [Arabidopsis suecica]
MQYTLIIYGQKHMIYARDLSIAWSDNEEYWSWLPLRYDISSQELTDAAVLEAVCWLDVNGKFDTRELTPATTYEVVYVVKLEDTAYGWKIPVNLKLTLPDSKKRPQERSVCLEEHIGKRWVDISAGEFVTSLDNAGEISFSMYETNSGCWKGGLFVKGVEIRPKN